MKLSPVARTALRSAITNHAGWDDDRKAHGLSLAKMLHADYLAVAARLGLDVEAIARRANAEAAASTFDACPVPSTVPHSIQGVPLTLSERSYLAGERSTPVDVDALEAAAKIDRAAGFAIEAGKAAAESARHAAGHLDVYPAPEAGPDEFEKMRDLMRAVANVAGGAVNENKVREIVEATVAARIAEAIANVTPTVRIDLTRPDGSTTKLEGLHHAQFPRLLRNVGAGLNVCVVGPAGSGKTTAASNVAKALGLRFFITGAARGEHEYLGFVDGHGQYQRTAFREAFENGGVFCADELDAGDPGVPLVLNSALANGEQSFPDSPFPVAKHPDFKLIACTNTFGTGADRQYVGRVQLDAAILDRFYFLTWETDEQLEFAIAPNSEWCRHVQNLRRKAKRCHAQILITPRATMYGAAAIAAGDTWDEAEEALIWKGCNADTKAKILNA